VTAEIEILAGQHLIDIRVAAGAKQIVDTPSILIDAIIRQTVCRDRDQGPEIRQVRPEPVERRHMGRLQLARPRRPKPLTWIMKVPNVQIADLGTFNGHDPESVPGWHCPGSSAPDWNDHRIDERSPFLLLGNSPVK
jgi:hypothetical protein